MAHEVINDSLVYASGGKIGRKGMAESVEASHDVPFAFFEDMIEVMVGSVVG